MKKVNDNEQDIRRIMSILLKDKGDKKRYVEDFQIKHIEDKFDNMYD